uniref:NACHT domain-containing protein n=2 Tax=Clytia hemisphaerica TaxID=252671 RepID=A0A7M5UW92_9CNID
MAEYQSQIDERLEEIEQQQMQENQSESLPANLNEDNEQLLRCVVEGMKLHISENLADENSILQQSKDLKEASKVRFQMAVDTCGNGRIKATTMKPILTIVTEDYYAKTYNETSSFLPSVRDLVARQKKFIPFENKIMTLENLIKTPSECLILIGQEGIGKSTLIDTILYQWGCDQLWGSSSKFEFNFVFVLHFRQLTRFQNQPGITAEEILEHFYPNLPLDLLITIQSEINCLLVLDGFDQYSSLDEFKKSSEEPSSFVKAVFDLLNPRSEKIPFTRIITTHPDYLQTLASVSLIPAQEKNDKISLKVVELGGLSFKSVNNYLTDYLKDDTPPKEVIDAVKSNKVLYDLMIVPSICQGMCELIDNKLLTDENLPQDNTTMFTLMFICRLWKRQFKEASTLNGMFIKPSFKESCINLATAVFHLETSKMVDFQLEDLPVESNIETLLEAGFIIKLNNNIDKPYSFSYQFLHRIFKDFLLALYVFSNGFTKESKTIMNKNILVILGAFAGASVPNSTSDPHMQKFCRLFNSNLTLDDILQSCNCHDSEKIQTLRGFLKSIRDDDHHKSKQLGQLLTQHNKNKTESPKRSPRDEKYDVTPVINALILYEFGFQNFKEVTLSKPVAIVGSALKPYMDNELRDMLKEYIKQKKIVIKGNK